MALTHQLKLMGLREFCISRYVYIFLVDGVPDPWPHNVISFSVTAIINPPFYVNSWLHHFLYTSVVSSFRNTTAKIILFVSSSILVYISIGYTPFLIYNKYQSINIYI